MPPGKGVGLKVVSELRLSEEEPREGFEPPAGLNKVNSNRRNIRRRFNFSPNEATKPEYIGQPCAPPALISQYSGRVKRGDDPTRISSGPNLLACDLADSAAPEDRLNSRVPES